MGNSNTFISLIYQNNYFTNKFLMIFINENLKYLCRIKSFKIFIKLFIPIYSK